MERARFGTLLKQHREAAALSQDALAERAGLSLDAVSALESGRSKTPRLETARRLFRGAQSGGRRPHALPDRGAT